ncbi:MAG: methyltransferase domain-containing protein [Bacteroidetes bacterium]|nr:methyltransferase domain-containing protein [Bacteroidota bacterium]
MNFKLLFPTFRNRYLFVKSRLAALAKDHAFHKGLNLGTGEGDYDQMVAAYCAQLIGCDVNEEDLAHARALNKSVLNLHYEVNNALNLSYPDACFDLLISCEVIEHVGQPAQMMLEIGRVLKPGAFAIMTFPSREFPFTYDPVNRIGHWTGKKNPEYLIAQGAYAFGHEYLIGSTEFKQWADEAGLEIVEFRGLSRYLVGLLEMYWTGWVQRIFKKNARNVTEDAKGSLSVRPASAKDPALAFVTDALLWIDRNLFAWTHHSVGKGIVLRKI